MSTKTKREKAREQQRERDDYEDRSLDWALTMGMTNDQLMHFDRDGQPAEIFLNSGKSGADLDALLGDAAVALSVALQSGVSASAMAKSIGRIPTTIDGPARAPASVVGAALDFLVSLELHAAAGR